MQHVGELTYSKKGSADLGRAAPSRLLIVATPYYNSPYGHNYGWEFLVKISIQYHGFGRGIRPLMPGAACFLQWFRASGVCGGTLSPSESLHYPDQTSRALSKNNHP